MGIRVELPSFTKLLPVLALAACSGGMAGQIRGTGQQVPFTYEQGIDHDVYETTIDGEVFSGKAVMDGSSTVVGNAFGANGFGTTVFGTGYTNRFVAVLLGNRGSSLNCQMRYADSSGFTTSGGVGVCNHSDGRVVDIVW